MDIPRGRADHYNQRSEVSAPENVPHAGVIPFSTGRVTAGYAPPKGHVDLEQ